MEYRSWDTSCSICIHTSDHYWWHQYPVGHLESDEHAHLLEEVTPSSHPKKRSSLNRAQTPRKKGRKNPTAEQEMAIPDSCMAKEASMRFLGNGAAGTDSEGTATPMHRYKQSILENVIALGKSILSLTLWGFHNAYGHHTCQPSTRQSVLVLYFAKSFDWEAVFRLGEIPFSYQLFQWAISYPRRHE